MTVIETKYAIGDVVYFATTDREKRRHACPDCNDTRKWKALSPAGREYEFACPRCATGYLSDRDLSVEYTAHTPAVHCMVIGSIKHDTWSWEGVPKTQYMCRETGVGSGNVYDEDKLHLTAEGAMTAAIAMAANMNKSDAYVMKLYDKTLKISDYQLSDTKMYLAKEHFSAADSRVWNVNSLCEEIRQANGIDEARDAVENYLSWDFDRDRKKLREAVLAECEAEKAEAADASA